MSVRPWIPPRRRVEAPDAGDLNIETEVPAPEEIKDVVPPSKIQQIMPLVMVVAIVGMIGIFIVNGGAKNMSPMRMLFPLMFIMSAAAMLGGNGNSGGPKTGEINGLRRKYQEMLTKLRDKVHNRATAQYNYLAHFAPPPGTLAAMVGGPRMWERTRPTEEPTYFLAPRVGLATQKLAGGMKMADAAPQDTLEPVMRVSSERFYRAHRAVSDMPVVIDLKTHRSVQFFGPGDVAGLIRSMLLQLAVLHPPNLVQIAVISENPGEWDWIKWLPHNQHPYRRDALGSERMVYAPDQVSEALAELLAGRSDFLPDDKYTGNKPWLIVVADGVGAVAGSGEGNEAVTVLRRGGLDEDGLEVVGARVEVDAEQGARKRRMSPDDALRYWVSTVDSVDVNHARQVARLMARWRAATDQRATATSVSGESESTQTWAGLHGVADIGAMGTTLWQPNRREGDPDRMRVPIGWDRSGAPMVLNIKEEAEQGMGSHGLILGYTGSGKSTLLVNLMLGFTAHHPPEQLNVIYIDYKGEATFDGFQHLNSTVEIISNLSSKDMISRLEAVLRGEVERRQRLRGEMGEATGGKKFRDARTYLKARDRGAQIPPFPTLLIVVDEFTSLLKDHPEFRDVFEHLARQGRSDRICLMLATQSLQGVSVGQLLSNTGWQIAMKTATAQDSASAIEVKDAYYLDNPGEGYLKVGGGDPRYFQGANPEALYFPPEAGEQSTERTEFNGATGVVEFGVESVHVPGQPDPNQPDDKQEPVVRTQEEVDNAPEVGTVVLNQLADKGDECYKMWLPPLLTPKPVGQLVDDSGLAVGDKAVLRLPIGLLDVPYKHKQQVFTLDLTDANLALLGRPRSGKSVALQTLAVSAALLNNPRRLQIYGLDFGPEGKLLALEGQLPHVGGVAMRRDTDAVARVIAEVAEVVTNRGALFREQKITSMAAYRERVAAGTVPDDGYGDVLLLIDGWDGFKEDHEDLVAAVAQLANTGLAVGVHVIVSLQVLSNLPRALSQSFSTRIDFKMNSPELSGVGKKLAEAIPGDVPGRAVDLDTHLHLMIGAPRLDDVETVDDAGLEAAMADISARWQGQGARRVRVLPDRLDAADLQLPANWRGSEWTVPIGLYEKDLTPVALDFLADRNLTVFGRKGSGKTHLLASVMQDLASRFTPEQVKFVVVDLKGSKLLDAVDENYLMRWDGVDEVANPDHNPADFRSPRTITRQVPRTSLVTNATELAPVIADVASALSKRAPTGAENKEQRRTRSWWGGPEIFLFVDEYMMVANAAAGGFAPLAQHWGNAAQLGMHSIVGCTMGQANRQLGAGNSLVKLNNDSNSAVLLMDGIRQEGPVLGVRLEPRQSGRGLLLNTEGQHIIQTPVIPQLEDM